MSSLSSVAARDEQAEEAEHERERVPGPEPLRLGRGAGAVAAAGAGPAPWRVAVRAAGVAGARWEGAVRVVDEDLVGEGVRVVSTAPQVGAGRGVRGVRGGGAVGVFITAPGW